MSGAGDALKASIKALGPTDIPGQMQALRGFNPFMASISPSRGLAIVHSRYPKETEASFRKLGFKYVGDTDIGLAGPGALIDTTGAAVTPWLAVIAHGNEQWNTSQASYARNNQVVKWLLGRPPNKDKGDENLENITKVRKVWDETFQKEREAFSAIGPDWWNEKNPEAYKAYKDITKGIMDADVVLAQAGIYGVQPHTSAQQQARKSVESTGTQKTPTMESPSSNQNKGVVSRADLNSMGNHELTPGTPEFAAERQRRVNEWRNLKSGSALKIPQ